MPGQALSLRDYFGLALKSPLAAALILTVLFAWIGQPQKTLSGSTQAPSIEYEVKAAFLLNFTKFIDWPPAPDASPDSPFAICILGNDPFGAVLEQTIQGETVNGRPLVARRTGHAVPKTCQILYVSHSDVGTKELLAGVGPGILTVGEGDSFTKDGGMIAFILDNRHVRFQINLIAAKGGMLKLSSRLLAVAKSIDR